MLIGEDQINNNTNPKHGINVEEKNQEKINSDNLIIITNNNQIETKINSITKSCKHFIKNLLKDLLKKHPENTNIICDYIIAEQIEFNIKESSKIGKIKALVYLSRYCE